MENVLRFTPEEMKEILGYNPTTDPDFESLDISPDADFQAHLEVRQFQIVIGNLGFGFFDMSNDDFEICLIIFAEEVVNGFDVEVGISYVDESKFRLEFKSNQSFIDLDGETLTPLAEAIETEVMEATNCAGALVGSIFNPLTPETIYFEFERNNQVM